MSNSYFQFLQFVVHQDKTAMKVSADAVTFGAAVQFDSPANLLDIGTGTGLLALMMAQRFSNAVIHAIEIDPSAAEQAQQNFQNSLWNERLLVSGRDFDSFSRDCQLKYDAIICNPPFFTNSLVATNESRTLARHDQTLSTSDLFWGVAGLLSTHGRFAVLVPFNRFTDFVQAALRHNLHETHILEIIPRSGKPPNRVVIQFSFDYGKPMRNQLIMRDRVGDITSEYRQLTEAFYL